MSQNLISLGLTEADYADIDAALAVLERHFKALIDLSVAERRSLTKMGDKSEAFCRQALRVLDQNRHVLPPTLDLAEAQHDLNQFDLLRTRASTPGGAARQDHRHPLAHRVMNSSQQATPRYRLETQHLSEVAAS